MTPFLKSVERSWLFTYDKIFVGTKYHKENFIKKRFQHAYTREARKKIVVTGAPWNVWTVQSIAYKSPVYKKGKRNRIIFPNRFDIEKRPNVFLKLVNHIYNVLGIKDLEFLITTSREKLTTDDSLNSMLVEAMKKVPTLSVMENLSKSEYYAALSSSKLMISTTIEENFGYCILEALSLNTPVIVPNNYSHPELLRDVKDKNYMLYEINWEAYKDDFSLSSDPNIELLSRYVLYTLNYLKPDDKLYESVLKYNKSIENMGRVII